MSAPPARVCPACGGALLPWRAVRSAEPTLATATCQLLRCAACGTAVTDAPPLVEAHDSGAYGARTPRFYALVRPILDGFDRRRLALLSPRVAPPARLLDAGAGRGRFLAAARAAGYDATGIEPSSRGVAAARALSLPVTQTTIEGAQIAPGSLDAVTLWHVLEHLDDPGEALARISGWLRPGGALLVGVPNLLSLQARLAPTAWYHFDAPRHRVHFTPHGLDLLLRRHGLQTVRTTHVLFEHNPYGMWQSLVSRATRVPSYLYNLLKHNATWRSRDLAVTLAAVPLAPAAALLELLAGLTGRGGTVAVLAVRAEYD